MFTQTWEGEELSEKGMVLTGRKPLKNTGLIPSVSGELMHHQAAHALAIGTAT